MYTEKFIYRMGWGNPLRAFPLVKPYLQVIQRIETPRGQILVYLVTITTSIPKQGQVYINSQ